MLKQQNNHWHLGWSSATDPLFTDGINVVTAQQWQQQLLQVKAYVSACSGNTVLLYQSDALWFSLWFVALSQLGKHIVLAPDNQPHTLALAMEHCDWQAPSALFEVCTINDDVNRGFQDILLLSNNTKVSFFTSGSTGQPKLVTKQLTQLLLEVQTLQAQFAIGFNQSTLFAATVSYQHIYGLLFRMLWPLCFGHLQYRQQLSYLEQWQDLLQSYQLVFIASPAHLARFDDIAILAPVAKQCLRIFSSGGPLADDIPARYIGALGQAPTEVFGSTETGGIAFRQRSSADTPWQAFSGISISQNQQLALQVNSPYLDGVGTFTTADQVQLLTADTFHLLGRLDRIVKIEEKRLSLPEVEHHCLTCPLVAEVAAAVLQQAKAQLALAVVLTEAGEHLLQQQGKLAVNQYLKQHLLQRFERVMLPKKFRYVSALPYNQQGKLPLMQLEALFYHD
ncbi:acyl-CoA synthetase [Rheinheimera sp. D18]|uniref:AMP-binding protein n=1 Tax=Rheinheimera sp. D18 TaxID=2545632 RepID=UPI001048449C|nr:AMP-binding protein [Rheinheimera sp. D18]QBL10697.1 acyl-CoA synthetase [Rheinheimera sp. D18]